MKMTPAELALVEAAGDLWNGYLKLLRDSGDEHPSERQEMCRDIHSIQQRIMARLATRVHPEVFPSRRVERPRAPENRILREGETPCPDCGGGVANLHIYCTSGPRLRSRPARRSIWQRLIARFGRKNADRPSQSRGEVPR